MNLNGYAFTIVPNRYLILFCIYFNLYQVHWFIFLIVVWGINKYLIYLIIAYQLYQKFYRVREHKRSLCRQFCQEKNHRPKAIAIDAQCCQHKYLDDLICALSKFSFGRFFQLPLLYLFCLTCLRMWFDLNQSCSLK